MDENQNEMAGTSLGINHLPYQEIILNKTDWEYAMRREMQGPKFFEIVPGLYLGPYAAAMRSRLDILLSTGITHIVCVRHELEANFIRPNFPSHFKYLVLDISDSPTENIIRHFRETRCFIDECLSQGGKVLVHGNGGNCRSAAVVAAYVMTRYSVSCSDALSVVRNHRFCIYINEGFLQQLMEYEHIYKAECFHPEASSTPAGAWKRKREADEEGDNRAQPCIAVLQPDQTMSP